LLIAASDAAGMGLPDYYSVAVSLNNALHIPCGLKGVVVVLCRHAQHGASSLKTAVVSRVSLIREL
ncbi:MAG: hypothetical protein KAG70_07040, partial [Alcanivorax sp.]|nr:hypothetical protein [Alcanivorax sp.]